MHGGRGLTGRSTNGATLAEFWNGTIWAIEVMPDPTPSIGLSLESVSCASATACIAVGNYAAAGGVTDTLAEVWNGSGWSLSSSQDETGSSFAILESVSCTAAATCTAAGYYLDGEGSGPYLPLIEKYEGGTWSIQATPSLPAASGYLYGLSCLTSFCMAAGLQPRGLGHPRRRDMERHQLGPRSDAKEPQVEPSPAPSRVYRACRRPTV